MADSPPPSIEIIPYTIRVHEDKPTLYDPVPEENVITADPQLDTEEGLQSRFCFEIQDEALRFDAPPVTWRDAPLPSTSAAKQPEEVGVEVRGGLLTITVTVPRPLPETITRYFDINVLYKESSTTLSIWTPKGLRRVDPTIVEKPAEGPPTGHGKGNGNQ
jgi:hypothetical protein